jgi:dipeptidyl aminopeptidase/acylaminoacyl peptidase
VIERLLDLRQPSDLQFTNDGTRFAFVVTDAAADAEQSPASRIWTGVVGGSVREATAGVGADILPRFSPDGSRLAFASNRRDPDRFSLFVLEAGAEARFVADVGGSIEDLQWTEDGGHILVLAFGRAARLATPGVPGTDSVEDDPEVWRPTEHRRTVIAVATDTGQLAPVCPRDLNVWEFSYHAGHIVAVVSDDPSEGAWYDARVAVIDVSAAQVRELYAPDRQVQSPMLSPDGARVAVIEGLCSDRGTLAGTIAVLELESGAHAVLAPELDVSFVAWVDATTIAYAGPRGLGSHCGFVSLAGLVDEVWSGPSQLGSLAAPPLAVSAGGRYFAASRDAPGEPPEVWVCDTAKRADGWHRITSMNDGLRGLPAPIVEELRWHGDELLEIEGLLLRPARRDDRALPLVVLVHGGPTSNWSYCFAPGYLNEGFILAQAGYAVLLPNQRGSTGRGQDFARANLGDLGGADFRDIVCGVRHCVETGLADAKRIGIMGVSAGGLMSAWAGTQTTEFAAAVAISCISDWLSFAYTSSVGRFVEIFLQTDPAQGGGRCWQLSPIAHVDRAETPTLILHGATDSLTPLGQAVELYNGLVRNGCTAELVVYPREGHGDEWVERDHLVDYWTRLREWFDRHLRVAVAVD